MRMMRRLTRDEGGAVAVIVGLALVVIFGMLALTLDLGRAVAVKRDMVNAADAAALAGAQECAMGHGIAAAQAAALQTATLNGATTPVRFEAPECDVPVSLGAKTVRVTYSQDVEYYIAPVLGFDGMTVTASATAIWGPAGNARPVPFVVEVGAFQGPCHVPDVDPGVLCPLWFDNDDFGGSTFGVLNLNGWDVAESANCSSKDLGANQHYAFVGGYDGQVMLPPLNHPHPTWVCAGDGNYQPVFLEGGLANNVDEILAFPVTHGCIAQGGKCDKFNVVGFARLQLVGVWKTNEAPAGCGTPPTNSSSHCILTRWVGAGFGNDSSVIGGVGFGLNDIRLVE